MSAATFHRNNRHDNVASSKRPGPAARARRAATITALALTLFGAGATVDAASAHAAPRASVSLMSAATTQQNVVAAVNAQREQHGLAPLTMSTALTNAAQGQSNYMASTGQMTHIGSGGSSVGQRVTRAGFTWSVAGENVAYGQTSSGAVVSAWMASPPHAAEILDPRFTFVGVGIAFADGVYWWDLTLAVPG